MARAGGCCTVSPAFVRFARTDCDGGGQPARLQERAAARRRSAPCLTLVRRERLLLRELLPSPVSSAFCIAAEGEYRPKRRPRRAGRPCPLQRRSLPARSQEHPLPPLAPPRSVDRGAATGHRAPG